MERREKEKKEEEIVMRVLLLSLPLLLQLRSPHCCYSVALRIF